VNALTISQASKTWVEALDTLLDAYEQTGEIIPLLRQYGNLFSNNNDMRCVLGYMYADILEFHKQALVIFKRKGYIFPWIDFTPQLANIINSLGKALPFDMEDLQCPFWGLTCESQGTCCSDSSASQSERDRSKSNSP
jgi:hypothetical protein